MKKDTESIRQLKIAGLPGVEALSGNDIVNGFRRHFHRSYIVGTITKGIRTITCTGISVPVSGSDIFILNPGQVHSCTSDNQYGHSYRILSISPDTMRKVASGIPETRANEIYFNKILYTDIRLSAGIRRMFNLIEQPEQNVGAVSGFYSFLSYLIRFFSEPIPLSISSADVRQDPLKRARNYIRDHFSEKPSLGKLAEIAGLSPFHFQRIFKKNLGITPHEYLDDLRIHESKQILLESGDIAGIANQLGFFDQSHFSRVFKKSVGVSPAKFARTNRAV